MQYVDIQHVFFMRRDFFDRQMPPKPGAFEAFRLNVPNETTIPYDFKLAAICHKQRQIGIGRKNEKHGQMILHTVSSQARPIPQARSRKPITTIVQMAIQSRTVFT